MWWDKSSGNTHTTGFKRYVGFSCEFYLECRL